MDLRRKLLIISSLYSKLFFMKIEALHGFHGADFSKGWADKFEPT